MPRIPADELLAMATSALHGAGLAGADAALVAESMVEAELEGHIDHGLRRLPGLIDDLRAGRVNSQPHFDVIRRRDAVAVLDADNGPGQMAAARAASLAVEYARNTGIGLVGVRRSNHLGSPSFHLRRITAKGMIGLLLSSCRPADAEARVDANPIAAAFPTSNQPVLVDLTVNPVGGIHERRRLETPVPEGWAVEGVGPGAIGLSERNLALALLVDVLAGLVSSDAGTGAGHCFIAIDPDAGTPGFLGRMDLLVGDLRRLAGRAPGDRRHAKLATRRAEGVEVSEDMIDRLRALDRAPL
ncbi:MAG TPA: Ldh family oxidoreductase [Candidatus Dormibacteraeota bacterium]|jgi:LDH2 family malate/lactate/ureidoglycolate dehydrogenase|nr:Ldh family oxidoreductase [Candidatus Dormibacteraeota bacterium]